MQFSQKQWSFGIKSLSRRSQQSQRSNRNHQVPGSLNCIYFLAIARIVVIKWKPACFSRCTKIPKRFRPTITQKAKLVFKQCMQICSSWNITSRMLQPYYPNSVIIQLYFLWLPSVLQPSKQRFALWSYNDNAETIEVGCHCFKCWNVFVIATKKKMFNMQREAFFFLVH